MLQGWRLLSQGCNSGASLRQDTGLGIPRDAGETRREVRTERFPPGLWPACGSRGQPGLGLKPRRGSGASVLMPACCTMPLVYGGAITQWVPAGSLESKQTFWLPACGVRKGWIQGCPFMGKMGQLRTALSFDPSHPTMGHIQTLDLSSPFPGTHCVPLVGARGRPRSPRDPEASGTMCRVAAERRAPHPLPGVHH